MRVFGVIKSFGKYDRNRSQEQDYGFIARDGQPDLFFHRSQVMFSEYELDAGKVVTFEIILNSRKGKPEAQKVNLLRLETDASVIATAAHSANTTVQLQAIPKWLMSQPPDVVLIEAIRCCNIFPSHADKQHIVSQLPDSILLQDRQLRDYLPLERRLDLCCALVEEAEPLTIALQEELIEVVYAILNGKHWSPTHESRVATLPMGNEIIKVVRAIGPGPYSKRGPDIKLIPVEFLQRFPLCRRLVLRAVTLEAIPVLVDLLRDERCWNEGDEGTVAELLWRDLPSHRKLYCIYCAAQQKVRLPRIERLRCDDPFVNAALTLLWARDHADSRAKAFTRAHTLFQDSVTEQAWNSTSHLDLSPALPECRQAYISVSYCEGRPWQGEGDSIAFCPRANSGCSIEGSQSREMRPRYVPGYRRSWKEGQRRRDSDYLTGHTVHKNHGSECFDINQLSGAQLRANCAKPWVEWSFLELLEVSGVVPEIAGELRSPIEYVPKLAGWVNRLNEIRARLKCFTCGQIMVPNYKYARHLARYNSTIASCEHDAGHDHNIYLNHCWACREIVDSRECKIRVEDFYLCLHCGSGPMRSNTYQQGAICPKCGSRDMKGAGRERACSACNHTMRLPAERHMTGRNGAHPLADAVDFAYDDIGTESLE